MSPAIIALIILGIVVFFYVTEWLPIAVTTVLGCLALVWLQVAKFSVAFSGFAADTLWLVIGMVMVGAALFETGLANEMGRSIIKFIGASEKKIILIVYPLAMLMSAFLNNTSTTATFTPIIQAISAKSNGLVSSKKLLMPLAFAATTGGMLTLVGSTPPVIVHGLMISLKLPTFGFFEWGYVGLPVCVALILYTMTIGQTLAKKMWKNEIEEEAKAQIDVVIEHVERPKNKMWLAGGVLAFCILGFILQPQFETNKSFSFTLGTVAITGAMLTVVLRTMSIKRLYELTDWNTFFVLGGAIGFAAGLDKSGAGKLIADTAIYYVGDQSPFVIFATFCLVGVLLTQMMSNTATTAMMAPIGIFVANGMGFSPLPLLMGLATVCAAAYMTPVGTPPNTIVLGPGNYKFTDYMKMGGIFQVVSFIIIILVVPMIWPL
ncbi:SLC13 family permease [Desulfosporosinus shakirovi]|uniref:SLC13 family permease n=1 Tax=Desulfosporosinus shakirovi TaxID=2885154 RepID=UPI001E2A3043|nr:SLC13 family permease [Desulfosporosinus sp. SRJS8]MCB8817145.1 SLC13 family permease [Desulfosporosinus sp. SRJS8]